MNRKTKKITDIIFRILLITAMLIQVCHADNLADFGLNQMDEGSCTQQLDEAEEFYYDGEFEKAISSTQECLKNPSVDKSILIRAYTILSRIYLAKGNLISAKENIKHVIDLDPSYEPTIEEETPKFVNLVSEVRKEVNQSQVTEADVPADSSGINPWVWIGAGSAAVAIIAIIASGSDDGNQNQGGEKPLPEPPTYPDSN